MRAAAAPGSAADALVRGGTRSGAGGGARFAPAEVGGIARASSA